MILYSRDSMFSVGAAAGADDGEVFVKPLCYALCVRSFERARWYYHAVGDVLSQAKAWSRLAQAHADELLTATVFDGISFDALETCPMPASLAPVNAQAATRGTGEEGEGGEGGEGGGERRAHPSTEEPAIGLPARARLHLAERAATSALDASSDTGSIFLQMNCLLNVCEVTVLLSRAASNQTDTPSDGKDNDNDGETKSESPTQSETGSGTSKDEAQEARATQAVAFWTECYSLMSTFCLTGKARTKVGHDCDATGQGLEGEGGGGGADAKVGKVGRSPEDIEEETKLNEVRALVDRGLVKREVYDALVKESEKARATKAENDVNASVGDGGQHGDDLNPIRTAWVLDTDGPPGFRKRVHSTLGRMIRLMFALQPRLGAYR